MSISNRGPGKTRAGMTEADVQAGEELVRTMREQFEGLALHRSKFGHHPLRELSNLVEQVKRTPRSVGIFGLDLDAPLTGEMIAKIEELLSVGAKDNVTLFIHLLYPQQGSDEQWYEQVERRQLYEAVQRQFDCQRTRAIRASSGSSVMRSEVFTLTRIQESGLRTHPVRTPEPPEFIAESLETNQDVAHEEMEVVIDPATYKTMRKHGLTDKRVQREILARKIAEMSDDAQVGRTRVLVPLGIVMIREPARITVAPRSKVEQAYKQLGIEVLPGRVVPEAAPDPDTEKDVLDALREFELSNKTRQ